MECPVCKKEFDEYTGRKPKKFCSDACKVKFWNAKKVKIVDLTNTEKKTNYTIDTQKPFISDEIGQNPYLKPEVDNSAKIKELEEEYKNVPDVGMGKKRRAFIEQQIYKLKWAK